MDDKHHFFKKKTKLWVCITIDHISKNFICLALGHRGAKTLREMHVKLVPHVFADHYECYRDLFRRSNLTQSKKYTSEIERNNGRQRHWLVVFRRRSIVVTRFLENLAIFLALFARFRINGSFDGLITLLLK